MKVMRLNLNIRLTETKRNKWIQEKAAEEASGDDSKMAAIFMREMRRDCIKKELLPIRGSGRRRKRRRGRRGDLGRHY